MKIELLPQARAQAVQSIRRYFETNLSEPLGELPGGLLLDFFLEEIGPAVYNQAINDAQTALQQRVSDLNGQLFVDEFQYWPRVETRRRTRR